MDSITENECVENLASDFDPIAYINTPRWQTMSLGLSRITALMNELGDPQERLKFVHVAGTNGKGSTCAYLSHILKNASLKTGLFTSPYIEKFEERIQINNCCIELDKLTAVTLEVKQAAERVEVKTGEHPTEFELMTAVAVCHFERENCDIVVLEVGLGGALDSTNVIPSPEVCVITRLGLDHTALLGDTLEQVAREKAGIIKPGSTLVLYSQEPQAHEVVKAQAELLQVPVCELDLSSLNCGEVFTEQVASSGKTDKSSGSAASEQTNELTLCKYRTFTYREFAKLETGLLGAYQPYNAACAIEAARCLRQKGWTITDDAIVSGIKETKWPGRFELYPKQANKPWLLVDGGHNAQGIDALADTLQEVFPNKKPILVFSVLADKDYVYMIRKLLECAKAFVVLESLNMRALSADLLAEEVSRQATLYAEETGNSAPQVQKAQDFSEACQKALALASDDDIVVFSGSLYSVALAKAAIKQHYM